LQLGNKKVTGGFWRTGGSNSSWLNNEKEKNRKPSTDGAETDLSHHNCADREPVYRSLTKRTLHEPSLHEGNFFLSNLTFNISLPFSRVAIFLAEHKAVAVINVRVTVSIEACPWRVHQISLATEMACAPLAWSVSNLCMHRCINLR
jgi:hypothetical protein